MTLQLVLVREICFSKRRGPPPRRPRAAKAPVNSRSLTPHKSSNGISRIHRAYFVAAAPTYAGAMRLARRLLWTLVKWGGRSLFHRQPPTR